jgi:ketosteroid isomerase-like protein
LLKRASYLIDLGEEMSSSRIKMLLLVLLSLPFFSYALENQNDAEFKSLVLKLVEAQRNYDASTLAALLHSDYLEISPVGEVDHRDKVLSFYHASNKVSGHNSPQIEVSELETKINGDFAFVIAKETFISPNNARQFSMRVSFTLHKVQGRWLFYNAQYTGIRP